MLLAIPMNKPPPPNHENPHHLNPPRPPKLSILAVVAIILAVIPVCPPVNLFASVLGMIARRRILSSQGRLRGLRLAQAAMITGFFLCIFSWIIISRFSRDFLKQADESMHWSIETVLIGAQNQSAGEALAGWSLQMDLIPPSQDILDFGQALTDRYGSFRYFTEVYRVSTGTLLAPRFEVEVVFFFEDADLSGSIIVDQSSRPFDVHPVFRLRSIVVEDPQLGDLSLPRSDGS